jgi:hypothetical protein
VIPGPHIAVIFGDVALCAGRDKIGAIGRAPLGLRDDVIKCDLFRLAAAVGAATLPAVDDLSPEAVFGDTFGNKL